MCDDDYSSLETEIETLKAIYIHELEINHDDRERPSCVTVHLYPATADNVTEQFVRLSLILQIPPEYPLAIPAISIRNTRGLSDEEIESIYQSTVKLAEERKGNAMLFELIEIAKEHLTVINIPSCECAVCLYGFVQDDALTKTECFHYFHSHCLARYVSYTLEKRRDAGEVNAEDSESETMVPCPVCRLPISFPFSDKSFPPPAESENVDISISTEQRKLQEEMQELFIKQKEKGGIIDLEAEKNKFLLEISNVQDTIANRSDTETVIGQIERCVTEKKESHVENAVKTSKAQISSRKLHKNENYLGSSSNEDRSRYLNYSRRNPYKQHGKFPNQSEKQASLEHNLESVDITKADENNKWNRDKKDKIVNRSSEEVHINDANDENQQETTVRNETGHRNNQRDKIQHRGANRRSFRGNYYSRQMQNWERHVHDKRLQINECKYTSERENDVTIQTTTNYSNNEIGRKLYSRSEQNAVIKRSKSPRKDIYNDKSNFRKHNEIYQNEERWECSKEHEERSFEEEGGIQRNRAMYRKKERGNRQYSGHYTRNYRKNQRFQSSFEAHIPIENTHTEKYWNESISKQNVEYDSTTNEGSGKVVSNEQEVDMSQNDKISEQSNTEQNSKSNRRNDNFEKEENKHDSEARNMDSIEEDHRNNMEEEATVHETEEQAELKKREYEDGKGSFSRRGKKYVDSHYRNYHDRKNNYQGFQSRSVDRPQSYNYESRRNYNRHYPNRNHLQMASKDKRNNTSDTEFSKGPCDLEEVTTQQDLKLDATNDTLGTLKNNKEMCREMQKNGDSYRERPRGHQGNYYRTNERRKYNSEVWDECNWKSCRKEFKSKDDIRQPNEEEQLKNNSESSLIESDGADIGKQSQKVSHNALRKDLAKAPVKHRNIYFYPKNRGNFHNNINRTKNESNCHTQQTYRDTRKNTSNNNAREHPIKGACQTDTIDNSSHR